MVKKPTKTGNKRFSILEYNVDIEFARNIIQVLDRSTEMLLNSKGMEEIKPENVIRRSYRSFKAHAENGKDYVVDVDFIRQHDAFSTDGAYIMDISMQSPYHGFYFGLYEIGEFEINPNTLSLHVNETYPCKYVGAGAVKIDQNKEKKIIYFGLRESEGDSVEGPHHYYIVKLDWASKKTKSKRIVWKKSVPAAVMSLLIHENLLFVGLKNGEVQVLDIHTAETETDIADKIDPELISYKGSTYRIVEKKSTASDDSKIDVTLEKVKTKEESRMIFNQKVFTGDEGDGEIARIEFLSGSSAIAVVGGIRGKRGDLAVFSCEGKLLLNSHLGNTTIKGIAQTPLGLFIVNTSGVVYHIQRELTEHEREESITQVQLGHEILSNIAVVRDWICGSGPETVSFIFSKDFKLHSWKHLDDTLARCVVKHDYGVITGDDLGKVRFWKIGDIQVHEDHN